MLPRVCAARWHLAPEAPRAVDLAVEGGAGLKAAVIPVVVVHYTTADPLA